MTLAPLFAASPVIVVHTLAALAAFVLGTAQLLAPKGGLSHRTLGWIWVVLMMTVALSSFGIHTICSLGSFSPIHGLSLFTLVALPLAVRDARRRRIGPHRKAMIMLFVGALLIAGAFTLLPGRLMHAILLGTAFSDGSCA